MHAWAGYPESPQQSSDFFISLLGKASLSCSLPLTQGRGRKRCSHRDDFCNTWDPSAAWTTRKGPRSCHRFQESLGMQQKITHTLAEVEFKTKQAIWTAWLMTANQASGKGVHVLLTGWSSHRGCRPGYTYGGDSGASISWDTRKSFNKLHRRLMFQMQQTSWTVGTRERSYVSINRKLAMKQNRESP